MLLGVANSDIPSASEQGCPCKSAIAWREVNDQLAIVLVDQFFVPIQRHGPVAQRLFTVVAAVRHFWFFRAIFCFSRQQPPGSSFRECLSSLAKEPSILPQEREGQPHSVDHLLKTLQNASLALEANLTSWR